MQKNSPQELQLCYDVKRWIDELPKFGNDVIDFFPTFKDTSEEIKKIAQFAQDIGNVKRIQ